MRTVRRLLYRDIVASVTFVALAFLSLFYFIDFVDELEGVGTRGKTVGTALLGALLELPGHLYELIPIAVLIGTIYSLARMAQSSEYTILRTGGLGPGRALRLLALLGLFFGVLTFLTGDFLAPAGERQAAALKARTSGGIRFSGAGAWLKEKRVLADGEHSFSVNVAGAKAGGVLSGIRIFEFDPDGRLVTRLQAPEGRVGDDGVWTLADAEVAQWPVSPPLGVSGAPASASAAEAASAADAAPAPVVIERRPTLTWPSSLTASVVAAAVLPLATMSTVELWRYSAHLSDQEQANQQHRIRFWRKALYPLACLVMMALALPFAYLHARAGSVSLKVFGGIMLGISFVLLNNLTGHIGMLRGWTPWVAAATPSVVYLVMSMAAFAWLVRYR